MMMWGIMILAGLVIFGSVYWLKPSARETRIAELRMLAIKKGIHVRHHKFEPDSAKTGVRDSITGTSYSWMRPGAKKPGDLLYSVVGQSAWDSEGLPEGLFWHQVPETSSTQESREQELQEQKARIGKQLERLLDGFEDELFLLERYENRVLLMPGENKAADIENYFELLQGSLD